MAGEIVIYGEGRLGSDPEIKLTPTGKNVTSFSIANTPRVNKDGEWVDKETIWLRCFIWGKNATGAANELRKGTLITFNGLLSQNIYIGKEGVEVKSLECTINGYGIVPRNVAEPLVPHNEKPIEDPIDDPWSI
jgi:single-strand DNA-binding protein